MGSTKILVFFLLFYYSTGICAKEVTDTLVSTKRDRVIVSYDIVQNNEQIVIKFLDITIRLGQTYREKYNKLNEVAVMFFDRIGNYEDNMEFTGMNVDAFMVPQELSYKVSKDGWFSLKDNPKLSMELKSSETAKLSIPIYLAHYEKKYRYKIFSRCEDLVIKLTSKKSAKMTDVSTSRITTQTVTSQEDVDESLSDANEANILIKVVYDLLDKQNGEDFSNELQQAISRLRVLKYSTSDGNLSLKIDAVLNDCKQKEKDMKADVNAAAEAAAREAELQAKLAKEQAQAYQDSLEAVAKIKAEEEKKQNLWMIIGGVILAILAFAGNLAFQQFRSAKNQKRFVEMQTNAVKQAENEAKRRARNMAQAQINRVQGEAKRKTRSAINDGIGKIGKKGKGNKGITI